MNEQYAHPTPEHQSQMELLERLIAPQPTLIGLEGGPCSGKTTLTDQLSRQSVDIGRPFIPIHEAATIHIGHLIAQGKTIPELATNDRPAYLEFQKDVLRTITQNVNQALHDYRGTNATILVDRPSIRSYVTEDEHRHLLKELQLETDPAARMDQLIFLPSVACVKPEVYAGLRTGNQARYETSAEQAAAVSDANLRAIQTHPELHIAWGGAFTSTIRSLAAKVLQPEIEGEIKQAVESNIAAQYIRQAAHAGNLLNVMDISQSYHRLNDQEFRLRRSSGDDGTVQYYLTIKTGEGTFRQELQRTLTKEQYELLQQTEQIGKVLHKLRHVVLDPTDSVGKRRLWYADRYLQPNMDEWHFETDVENEQEVDELALLYRGLRRRVFDSAKTLIFK